MFQLTVINDVANGNAFVKEYLAKIYRFLKKMASFFAQIVFISAL